MWRVVHGIEKKNYDWFSASLLLLWLHSHRNEFEIVFQLVIIKTLHKFTVSEMWRVCVVHVALVYVSNLPIT